MPESPIILPPKYYLEYYQYILRYIERHYQEILQDNERQFIDTLHSVHEDSFCLYLRIAGRRNRFFRPSQLQYDEIEDTNQCIIELLETGLIESINQTHESYLHDWLNTYTKSNLYKAFQTLNATEEKISKSIRKGDLLTVIESTISFGELRQYFVAQEQVIVQGHLEAERLIRYLFFGNLHGSTTDFVVRDVGHRHFEEIDEDQFTPIFDNRQEIDECLFLSLIHQEWYALKEADDVAAFHDWFVEWYDADKIWCDKAQLKIDKLLVKTGRYFEQQKKLEWALAAFEGSIKPPSRERQARIHHKLKDKEQAIVVCQQMLEAPQNVKEEIFAKDFIRRLSTKKALLSTRTKLKEADSLVLPIDWKYEVENGVLQHYFKKGYSGIHGENSIWRSMFGVVFWDLLYDTEAKAIHHPLQYLPSDFYSKDFYKNRQDKIEACLLLLDDKKKFDAHLIRVYEQKWGVSNHLVAWSYDFLEVIRAMYAKLKAAKIKLVLQKICENVRDNLKGFPDLFVWKKRAYYFIEVKSPTDMLSEQQLFWINFFEEHKIKAKVLKVEWKKKMI